MSPNACVAIILIASLAAYPKPGLAASGWIVYEPPSKEVNDVACANFIAASARVPVGSMLTVDYRGERAYTAQTIFIGYAKGYITAYNLMQATNDKQVRTNNDVLDLSLRNYCNAHPADSFIDAVIAFAKDNLKAR
jgi:hypothetical protein